MDFLKYLSFAANGGESLPENQRIWKRQAVTIDWSFDLRYSIMNEWSVIHLIKVLGLLRPSRRLETIGTASALFSSASTPANLTFRDCGPTR
jgi:hypothetical protein